MPQDVFDVVADQEKKKDIFDTLSDDVFDSVVPDTAGDDYLKRVAESKKQPPGELSQEEKERTGQVYAEPGEITGGTKENDPFTGKTASDEPLVGKEAIKNALSLVGERKGVTSDPVQDKINQALADRLSGMTTEKFVSTLPMYAIPGYPEVQGLEGLSQSVPELSQGLKEGDPEKITGGSLDSIIGALMLGHRAIPRGRPQEGGEINDLRTESETPPPQKEVTLQGQAEPVGVTETLAELKRRNGAAPGEVKPQDIPQAMAERGGSVEDVVVDPTEQGGAGISEARTKAELGKGSVEPGVGAELGSGLEYGRNFINKGGDPRLPIRRALTSGLVGKNEVGIVHAELERLRGERNQAAEALERNPADMNAQSALDAADAAQRAWRKELQPVLTKASDALREAYAESAIKPDLGTYQGLADLMDEHFGGKRDLTPDDRVKLRKAAKGVRDIRAETRSAVDRASAQIARKTKKIMTPDELRMDLTSVLKDAFKDCVI